MKTQISIIIPVYNAELFLEQTIQSIENQSLSADEIILINDGSKDNSWNIMQSLATRDKKIKIHNQDNAGPSITRNRGVVYAQNEWICFVDADDLLHPQRLELAYAFTDDVDAVICEFKRFSENAKPIFPELKIHQTQSLSLQESYESVLKYGYGLPRMLMKKSVFLNSGGIDTELINNEDHELHFRMLTQKVKFRKIDAALYYYRQHQSKSRLANHPQQVDYIYKALYKMQNQIPALPTDLQAQAKKEIGNRLASNALKQARLGQKVYKTHLKNAINLNPNIRPYKKSYHNALSKFLGFGNLESFLSKIK